METEKDDKDYASKGVAGTGLGLGIAGTALGLLASGGLGGGLFGGGMNGMNGMNAAVGAANATATMANTEIAQLRADIAKLESEKYTDAAVQAQARKEDEEHRRQLCWTEHNENRIAKLEVYANEVAPLREQLVESKITALANTTQCGLNAANTAIQNLAATVSNVTKVVIPNSNVCPGWGPVTITPTVVSA